MPAFAILSNRKRAMVALIHTAAFLGLAVRDFVVSARLSGILAASTGTTRSRIFAVVYLIVCAILAYLLIISRCAAEQVYFAFCTASAGTGVVRALAGDAAFPSGQYVRMALLGCAVLAGVVILKVHSSPTIPFSEAYTSVGEGADV